MENWLGDDLEFMDTKRNFDKYLSAQPDDMDLSYFEQDDLEKILILPNGHMIDASQDSMLASSLEFKKTRQSLDQRLLKFSQNSGLATSMKRKSSKKRPHMQSELLTSPQKPLILSEISERSLSGKLLDTEGNQVEDGKDV